MIGMVSGQQAIARRRRAYECTVSTRSHEGHNEVVSPNASRQHIQSHVTASARRRGQIESRAAYKGRIIHGGCSIVDTEARLTNGCWYTAIHMDANKAAEGA